MGLSFYIIFDECFANTDINDSYFFMILAALHLLYQAISILTDAT